MRRALVIVWRVVRIVPALAMMLFASVVHAWKERTDGDMPWLGSGGRARYYTQEKAGWGLPTGYRIENKWGRSTWTGEDPYITAGRAMGFLNSVGVLSQAPPGQGAGSVATESGEIVQPRALPYGFTVVMIEPTVVIMNFDLVALTRGDESPEGQVLGSALLNGWIRYGTHVPATGTLLWFSQDAKQAPVPVPGQASDNGEIMVKGVRLSLHRQGYEWVVTRP